MTYLVSNCRFYVGLLWLVAAVGCMQQRLDVFPVAGMVMINGEPARNAEVVFFGQDQIHHSDIAPFPKATTDANGKFVVSSYQPGDGAPAGEYRVTIICRESDSNDPEIRDQSPNIVPPEFADPEASPLQVTVKPEENQIDLEIP